MKKLLKVLLILICVVSLAACSGNKAQDEGTEKTEGTGEKTGNKANTDTKDEIKELDIAFVIPSTESQYWGQYLATGVENACIDIEKNYGVKANMTIYGPATEAETDSFLSTLEGVIAKKPDAIVLGNLIPDAVAPLIEEAAAQGIYVNLVSIGAPADESAYGSLYYCDQPEQGIIAAEAFYNILKEKGLSEKGVVGVHMSVVVPILEEKIQNFRTRLSELAPELELLETIYNENDVNNAIANVENQIATHGDELVGFFGANNISGDGIVTSIANAGIGDQLVSIAVDSDELEIQALKEGNLDAIVVQTPYAQGYEATMNCYEYIVNKENDDKNVNLSAKVVTSSNMNDEEYAALLNPLLLKQSK